MRQAKMAGPFRPIPAEVFGLLRPLKRSLRRACFTTYGYMLNEFPIEEDPEVEGDWVAGRIRATHREIARATDDNWGWFQKIIWPTLLERGLVRDVADGVIQLPMLYKKGDAYVMPLQARKEISALREDIRDLKHAFSLIVGVEHIQRAILDHFGDESKNEWRATASNLARNADQIGGGSAPPTSFKGFKRKRLSLSGSKVISGFYRGIGQKKISKEKRERANLILKKLREDGFSLDDIALAVKWTLENAKEELYDFSIIQHTIGQAIAARKKEEAKAKEIEQRERAATEERQKREREESERERIEAHKESLAPEERAALREQAEKELRESGEFKKEFIDDFLIGIKEREILQRQIAEQSDQIEQEDI